MKVRFGQAVTIGACVFSIGVACFFGYRLRTGEAYYNEKLSENQALIAQYELQIENLNSQPLVTKQDIQSVITNAVTAGDEVASLQNRYFTAGVNAEELKAIASGMDVYLSETARSSRVPWYVADGMTSVSWTFETTYSISGTKLPCVWLCRDSGDRVLAYAMGTYDSEAKVFADVLYGVTTLGVSLTQSENYGVPGLDATQAVIPAMTEPVAATELAVQEPVETLPVESMQESEPDTIAAGGETP